MYILSVLVLRQLAQCRQRRTPAMLEESGGQTASSPTRNRTVLPATTATEQRSWRRLTSLCVDSLPPPFGTINPEHPRRTYAIWGCLGQWGRTQRKIGP